MKDFIFLLMTAHYYDNFSFSCFTSAYSLPHVITGINTVWMQSTYIHVCGIYCNFVFLLLLLLLAQSLLLCASVKKKHKKKKTHKKLWYSAA